MGLIEMLNGIHAMKDLNMPNEMKKLKEYLNLYLDLAIKNLKDGMKKDEKAE